MLFRRLLLSLFPEPEGDLQFNPATFFINFVSAKQFFTVILRKIVENYKLYFYDINFDPFEVKIGFGETPTIRLHEVEKYFAYISVAELNGYRFFSPAVVSTSIGFVVAYKTYDIFRRKWDYKLFINFVLTAVLLYYVFLARIKTLKHQPKEPAYKHFVEIFFNFFKLVNEKAGLKVENDVYEEIKSKLLKERIDMFLFLFFTYAEVERVFFLHNVGLSDKDFFERLFYDDIKVGKYKNIIKDYLDNFKKYQKSAEFSTTEKMILNLILPADVLIRFFLDGPDVYEIVDNVLGEVFDDTKIDTYLKNFLNIEEGEKAVQPILEYLTDYKIYKKSYFKGVKKFLFKSLNVKQKSLPEEYVEDLLSSFSPDMKLPPEIKREGMLAERLVNFYLSFVGSFWIGRGDTGYFRIFKKEILERSILFLETKFTNDTFYFLSNLLYFYGKNVFYYQYAFESIRDGKQTFRLPTRPLYRQAYTSSVLIHLLNEAAFINLLEDINYKDIKLYVREKKVLNLFKENFGKQISDLLSKDKEKFLDEVYGIIFDLLGLYKNIFPEFVESITDQEIGFIKSNLYTFDFWLFRLVLEAFKEHKAKIKKWFGSIVILHILAILRQTLFGFLLFYHYLISSGKENLRLQELIKIYEMEVLSITGQDEIYEWFNGLLIRIYEEFKSFFDIFVKLDDNKEFLTLLEDNWSSYIDSLKPEDEALAFVKGEDVVWFRGALKNMTFYNKRYFIPQI